MRMRMRVRTIDQREADLAASMQAVDAKHEELRTKETVLDGLLRDADAIREDLRNEASLKEIRVELRKRVLAKTMQMQQQQQQQGRSPEVSLCAP